MRYKAVVISIFIILLIRGLGNVSANDEYVSIVNPVRIAPYTKNVENNIKAQYSILNRLSLSGTWLVTYDVLLSKSAVLELKKISKNQELGIFLEITPKLAADANINYHNLGSWHFSNSIFLSGYSQKDRQEYVDLIFKEFKSKFGYYPKSIGSWWTDSFSLAYIKQKYPSVIANLVCSDQQDTDNYTIRGQYWSTPYYPSKWHAATPAQTLENKLDIVNIQWASRDPGHGFENSRYSTQDYFTIDKLSQNYFEYLVQTYTQKKQNPFSHIVVGLESDFSPEVYSNQFKKQMEYVSKIKSKDNIKVITMSEFSSWYRKKFPDLSPKHDISALNYFDSKEILHWVNTKYYRVGYVIKNRQISIRSLIAYSEKNREPYFSSINTNKNLDIYIPSIVDEVRNKEEKWTLPIGAVLFTGESEIAIANISEKDIPKAISNNNQIKIQKISTGFKIDFTGKSIYSGNGKIISGLSSESKHFLNQKKAILLLLNPSNWKMLNTKEFVVSQGEIEALEYLKNKQRGRILVENNECLQCGWSTGIQPAVFANNRGYINEITHMKVIKDKKIFDSINRQEAKKELETLQIKYIYLIKTENYIESLPFSPGDLGVRKIFENANAQIWEKE